jgi:hypothetical protein
MPPRIGCSGGRICTAAGRRGTWIIWSTSSAARRRSSSCGSGSPPMRSRTWASRSSRTGCVTAGRSTPWPPGRARRSRPWAWACRCRRRAAQLAEAPGGHRRHRDRLRRAQRAPRLPVRVVHRRRRPVHRGRRHPRDHRLSPAAGHGRGLALHPGSRLLGRPRRGRAVPVGELAGRL